MPRLLVNQNRNCSATLRGFQGSIWQTRSQPSHATLLRARRGRAVTQNPIVEDAVSVPSASNQAMIYQRPVELLQNLIRFDTTNPPGNEEACIRYIQGLLNEAGLETTLLARSPERPNLITRLAGQGNAPPLLLYGHVDVVTTENQIWQQPPFEAKCIDGYVWGRGALDMKDGIAMILAALLRAKTEGLTLPGDVILAVVCDEEADGVYGSKYLVENHAALP